MSLKRSQSNIKTKSFPKLPGPEYPETIKWVLLERKYTLEDILWETIKWVLLEGKYIVGVSHRQKFSKITLSNGYYWKVQQQGDILWGWLALEDDILGTVYCFTTCPDYTNNSTEGGSSRNEFLLRPHFEARTESGI